MPNSRNNNIPSPRRDRIRPKNLRELPNWPGVADATEFRPAIRKSRHRGRIKAMPTSQIHDGEWIDCTCTATADGIGEVEWTCSEPDIPGRSYCSCCRDGSSYNSYGH